MWILNISYDSVAKVLKVLTMTLLGFAGKMIPESVAIQNLPEVGVPTIQGASAYNFAKFPKKTA